MDSAQKSVLLATNLQALEEFIKFGKSNFDI
jgi:hypothetical protein